MQNKNLIHLYNRFGFEFSSSAGTDHGKANNLFLIGNNFKKAGIYKPAADLSLLNHGDRKHKVDFRNVYWDIINDRFGQDASKEISKSFNNLGII